MMAIIWVVVMIVIVCLLYVAVDSQQMGDDEREKNGLGPKGQGR